MQVRHRHWLTNIWCGAELDAIDSLVVTVVHIGCLDATHGKYLKLERVVLDEVE